MLQFETGLSRRRFFEGSVALGAFMMPRVVGAIDSRQDLARRAKSVIVLLQEGGMSHFESWDPKPDAPAEIRGSFKTIKTTNPELMVGEHMPLLAKQAHLYDVVRSVYMDNARRDHSPGLHWVLTGYDNQAAGVGLMKVNKDPSVGSIIAHELGGLTDEGLPNFVAIPSAQQLGGRVNYASGLHLGAHCNALDSGTVPQRADQPYVLPVGLTLPGDISVRRLQDRNRLLASIDRLRRQRDQQARRQSITEFQQSAFDMLVGRRGQEAFDINQEPVEMRRRYGDSSMGQGTLLARRLVEAGVTYVLVNYSKNNSWDTHSKNFDRLKKNLLPPMDQAAAALLVDLQERGMLDDVLVLMMGEMGRTPKINKNSGRDHWPDVFSLMIAGGGLTRGQVLGSSSRLGDTPKTRPVHYHEILATVYHQLGIDPNLMIKDRQDRPVRIMPEAEPVHELIL
ncbi:MAG: DUF1501 domain-containing protein [Planctomycetes bacterium]|nr:DUF1501 domain-containing protein [Planctomycetota bacterium]